MASLNYDPVYCYCTNCNTKIGTCINHWMKISNTHLTTLAARDLDVFDSIAISKEVRAVRPGSVVRALEGCHLQEVRCKVCATQLGAFCVEGGSPDKQSLVGKVCFRIPKIILRDTIAGDEVEPHFIATSVSLSKSTSGVVRDNKPWRLPNTPQHSSKHRTSAESRRASYPVGKPAIATYVTEKSTAQDSPRKSDHPVFRSVLQRADLQGKQIERISKAVQKLQNDVNNIKQSLSELRKDGHAPYTKQKRASHGSPLDSRNDSRLMVDSMKEIGSKATELDSLRTENEDLKRELQHLQLSQHLSSFTNKPVRASNSNGKRTGSPYVVIGKNDDQVNESFDSLDEGISYYDFGDSFLPKQVKDITNTRPSSYDERSSTPDSFHDPDPPEQTPDDPPASGKKSWGGARPGAVHPPKNNSSSPHLPSSLRLPSDSGLTGLLGPLGSRSNPIKRVKRLRNSDMNAQRDGDFESGNESHEDVEAGYRDDGRKRRKAEIEARDRLAQQAMELEEALAMADEE